jgi:hypothetical protein
MTFVDGRGDDGYLPKQDSGVRTWMGKVSTQAHGY